MHNFEVCPGYVALYRSNAGGQLPDKTYEKYKMEDLLVYRTAVFSLIAQLIIGGFTSIGFFVNKDEDVSIVFALELVSQAVEFLWYLVVVCRYRKISTWTRYIDWVLSTPVMLVSTVLFFLHRTRTSYSVFLQSGRFYMLLSLNWLMLSFGFAMELTTFPKFAGLLLGSGALAGSFATMGTYVNWHDDVSVALFSIMLVIWALYGVAAALPYTPKNVGYNGLDVVSKNFYGLFLTVYVITM